MSVVKENLLVTKLLRLIKTLTKEEMVAAIATHRPAGFVADIIKERLLLIPEMSERFHLTGMITLLTSKEDQLIKHFIKGLINEEVDGPLLSVCLPKLDLVKSPLLNRIFTLDELYASTGKLKLFPNKNTITLI